MEKYYPFPIGENAFTWLELFQHRQHVSALGTLGGDVEKIVHFQRGGRRSHGTIFSVSSKFDYIQSIFEAKFLGSSHA